MTSFSTEKFNLRNAWPSGSGEIAVREAFAPTDTTGTLETADTWAGFSVKCPRTNVVFHYIVSDQGGNFNIFDENIISIQRKALTGSVPKRVALCYAIVEDEIIVTSPYFPTLWGLLGNGLIQAVKVASVNPNTTAIDIPKGISVGWAGRAVISDGEALYFSDALAPRTFTAENIVVPPGGTVYALHVNSGGALIIVTENGVYALPEDAAASGQLVVGVFSKLTDYCAIDYETTCVSHGQVYGMTQKGYRRIDIEGSDEVLLDEDNMSRSDSLRIAFTDYRRARMFSAQSGPIVSISARMYVSDLATSFGCWWVLGTELSLTGILFDNTGEEFYLVEQNLYSKSGNNSSEETVSAFTAGRIVPEAGQSRVIREIEFVTDAQDTLQIFLNTATKTITPKYAAPQIDVDTWDTAGLVYREAPLRDYRAQWSVRGNEIAPEIKLGTWPAILPLSINIDFKGPGKNRPSS